MAMLLSWNKKRTSIPQIKKFWVKNIALDFYPKPLLSCSTPSNSIQNKKQNLGLRLSKQKKTQISGIFVRNFALLIESSVRSGAKVWAMSLDLQCSQRERWNTQQSCHWFRNWDILSQQMTDSSGMRLLLRFPPHVKMPLSSMWRSTVL